MEATRERRPAPADVIRPEDTGRERPRATPFEEREVDTRYFLRLVTEDSLLTYRQIILE